MSLAKIAFQLIASEAVIKLGKEAGKKILKKGATEAGTMAVDKAKNVLNSKKDANLKYENLRQTFTATNADFETFIKAINESSNMLNFYKYELVDVHEKNPRNKVKLNKLTASYQKWDTLLSNLREEARQRVKKEASIVYERKVKSDFFNNYDDINDQLISSQSKEDLIKALSKVYSLYLKDFKKDK